MNGYPKRKEQTNNRINLLSLLNEKAPSNYVIVYYDVPERKKS